MHNEAAVAGVPDPPVVTCDRCGGGGAWVNPTPSAGAWPNLCGWCLWAVSVEALPRGAARPPVRRLRGPWRAWLWRAWHWELWLPWTRRAYAGGYYMGWHESRVPGMTLDADAAFDDWASRQGERW